ncbi:MAG TPA: FAD-binding protein [Syntrophorhabdaceae bacterium]|nr:FAD-binding protein [Syntrophorhabdaceae bacterium]
MLTRKVRWDFSADVIVVGYGAAGAVAAITARDGGAQVVILEKQENEKLVTTSYMSGGQIICPSDREESERYMKALARVTDEVYWTDPEVISVWASYSIENRRWLEKMGIGDIRLSRHGGEHRLPGFESIDTYQIPGMGPGLMRELYRQVDLRGVPVEHGLAAHGLLLDGRGGVMGVRAQRRAADGKPVNVEARRAVVLTTGGFEFNEQMKLQYLRVYPSYFTGSPANTGDGVKIAADAGAQLWHMNCCSARLVMKFAQVESAFTPTFGGVDWRSPGGTVLEAELASGPKSVIGYVVVDRFGRRYMNENFKGHSIYYDLAGFDSQQLLFPRVPSYWVFDSKRMGAGPIALRRSGPAGPAQFYRWSADNDEEVGRGWIKQGKNIEELARELGMKQGTLAGTVAEYNVACTNGTDTKFSRQPHTMAPLDSPPFYAVALWPGGPNTQGGPRRNRRAQILRSDGSPVPRLYGAGELGSIYGMLYPSSGGNLAECVAFGRIAGENASLEKPR